MYNADHHTYDVHSLYSNTSEKKIHTGNRHGIDTITVLLSFMLKVMAGNMGSTVISAFTQLVVVEA